MTKTMMQLLAGILVAWVVISIVTKDFDGSYLFPLLIGVLLGREVTKKEMKDEEGV